MKKFSFLLVFLFSVVSAFAQKEELLGTEINSEYAELHPLVAPDGKTLYFVRSGHPQNNFTKGESNDVWYSEKNTTGTWSKARKMPNTINKSNFNDIFSVSPDGNTLLIRGVYKNGRQQNSDVGISFCKKTARSWTQPEALEIPKLNKLSKGHFLSAQLSNNGKVLIMAFSEKRNSTSDDLYVSLKNKKGEWSEPQNLGNQINTSSTETTPYLAADEHTLYFASDRKGGLGGTDIWVTRRRDRTWKRWTAPQNLGEKINTDTNDLYYSITADGKFAFLTNSKNAIGSSDIKMYDLSKNTGNASDLASLNSNSNSGNNSEEDSDSNKNAGDKNDKNSGKNSGDGTDLADLITPTPVVVLSGKVLDSKTGKPMEATIRYEDLATGEDLGEATNDPLTGEYKIMLPYGKRYTIRAENNDFIAFEKTIDLTREGEYQEILNNDLQLAPIEEGSKVALNNIFFQFAKATLQEESFLELNRLVELLNKRSRMVIEVQGHTDDVGSDENNMKLSEARAEAVTSYLVSKGVKASQVTSKGYGESQPIASNETTEGQAQNRRVEVLILQK